MIMMPVVPNCLGSWACRCVDLSVLAMDMTRFFLGMGIILSMCMLVGVPIVIAAWGMAITRVRCLFYTLLM